MKLSHLLLLLPCLAICSCDKAKNIADKARSVIDDAGKSKKADTSKPDPELLKLVDQTEEGYHFRSDLPFPAKVEVKVTHSMEIDGRSFEASILGNSTDTVKGTQKVVSKFEKDGDHLRYTMQEATFAEPVVSKEKDAKPVVQQLSPPAEPRVFKKTGSKWAAGDSGSFRSAVLSRELSPVFETLLEENALQPRDLWLGKKRIKVGTEIPVPAESLKMLVSGKAKGSYLLKLESIGAVDGHPCGVFFVTGDYSRKNFPDFEADFSDEEVTVQSGKLWLSLLYPLVLREELDTIQTYRSGADGSPALRIQGAVKLSIIREWKKL